MVSLYTSNSARLSGNLFISLPHENFCVRARKFSRGHCTSHLDVEANNKWWLMPCCKIQTKLRGRPKKNPPDLWSFDLVFSSPSWEEKPEKMVRDIIADKSENVRRWAVVKWFLSSDRYSISYMSAGFFLTSLLSSSNLVGTSSLSKTTLITS